VTTAVITRMMTSETPTTTTALMSRGYAGLPPPHVDDFHIQIHRPGRRLRFAATRCPRSRRRIFTAASM
jgi:hypothetical protein